MTAVAAVGEIAGIATLIGNIYNGIGAHVIGKATLQALLLEYQVRLEQDHDLIQRGLELRDCQPRAQDLYEKTVVLGKWLANKHIKLGDQSGPVNRPWWKFPWKFSNRKKEDFKFFLDRVQHASERLVDCVQNLPQPHNDLLLALPAAAVAPPPAGLPALINRAHNAWQSLQ